MSARLNKIFFRYSPSGIVARESAKRVWCAAFVRVFRRNEEIKVKHILWSALIGFVGCVEKEDTGTPVNLEDLPMEVSVLLAPASDESRDAEFNPGESFLLTVNVANTGQRELGQLRAWLRFDDSRIDLDPAHTTGPIGNPWYSGECSGDPDYGDYSVDGPGVLLTSLGYYGTIDDFEPGDWMPGAGYSSFAAEGCLQRATEANDRLGDSYYGQYSDSRGIRNLAPDDDPYDSDVTPPELELTELRYDAYESTDNLSRLTSPGFIGRLDYFDPGESGTDIQGVLRIESVQEEDACCDEEVYFGTVFDDEV